MEHSPELRDLTLRLYQAMASGDISFIERSTARAEGTIGIGADPEEWWAGYGPLMRAWRIQLREMGGSFPITPGDPQAYREGTVGWVADRATVAFPGGPTVPLRITLVFHQEEGAWKMAQFHVSTGVPNAEALGKELTI